jgi:hypothetical protein
VNDYIKTHPAVSTTISIRAAVALAKYERAPRAHRLAVREQVVNVDNCCTIEYIARFLGHAGLRERMTSDGILQADGVPYQQYLDCGYLAAVERINSDEPEVFITPWGQSWLYNRYGMTDAARITHEAAKAIQ